VDADILHWLGCDLVPVQSAASLPSCQNQNKFSIVPNVNFHRAGIVGKRVTFRCAVMKSRRSKKQMPELGWRKLPVLPSLGPARSARKALSKVMDATKSHVRAVPSGATSVEKL
jgi:hypothetical protein